MPAMRQFRMFLREGADHLSKTKSSRTHCGSINDYGRPYIVYAYEGSEPGSGFDAALNGESGASDYIGAFWDWQKRSDFSP